MSVGRVALVRETAEVVRTIGDPPVLASVIAVAMSPGVEALIVWARAPEATARAVAAPAVARRRRRAVRNPDEATPPPFILFGRAPDLDGGAAGSSCWAVLTLRTIVGKRQPAAMAQAAHLIRYPRLSAEGSYRNADIPRVRSDLSHASRAASASK